MIPIRRTIEGCVEYSPETFQDFAKVVDAKVRNKRGSDAADECLRIVENFVPEGLAHASRLQKLAAMVRAGGDSPLAHKIAGFVLHSVFIHQVQSAADIGTFCVAAPHHHVHEAHAQEPPRHPSRAGEAQEDSLSVDAMKKDLVKRGIALTPSFKTAMKIPSVFLAGAFGLAALLGLPAILSASLGGPAGFGLSLAFGVVAGMIGAVGLVGFALISGIVLRQKYVLDRDVERAHTPTAMAAVFNEIEPKAQAYLFDTLGPDFRNKVLKENKNDLFLRECKGLWDVLEDPNASPALKEEAFQRVSRSNLRYDGRYDDFVGYVLRHHNKTLE